MNAYSRIMKAEINNRFGEKFIQKLIIESDSIYYQNNKDLTFDLNNSYAALKYYRSKKYRNYFDSITNQIKISLKYPKGYKFYEGIESVYTSVKFILTKTSSIDSLYISSFRNLKNKKFKNYLESQIINSLIKTKIDPIIVYGQKINTKQSITIYHKKI